ncbi:MAG: hypothetical protein [Circular genetic element sp.]|nr:MAG: hypothetical protein [Circular genetic element sp.]
MMSFVSIDFEVQKSWTNTFILFKRFIIHSLPSTESFLPCVTHNPCVWQFLNLQNSITSGENFDSCNTPVETLSIKSTIKQASDLGQIHCELPNSRCCYSRGCQCNSQHRRFDLRHAFLRVISLRHVVDRVTYNLKRLFLFRPTLCTNNSPSYSGPQDACTWIPNPLNPSTEGEGLRTYPTVAL